MHNWTHIDRSWPPTPPATKCRAYVDNAKSCCKGLQLQPSVARFMFQQVPTRSNTFQHVPTRSNTFQHIPTHSNTFQHVPTRWSFMSWPSWSCNCPPSSGRPQGWESCLDKSPGSGKKWLHQNHSLHLFTKSSHLNKGLIETGDIHVTSNLPYLEAMPFILIVQSDCNPFKTGSFFVCHDPLCQKNLESKNEDDSPPLLVDYFGRLHRNFFCLQIVKTGGKN